MDVFFGIVGAAITWLLTTGFFVLLDNLFSLTDKINWMALVFLGVPILLAWLAYHITPVIFSFFWELLRGPAAKPMKRSKTREVKSNSTNTIDVTPNPLIITRPESASPIKADQQPVATDWLPKRRNSSYFHFHRVLDGIPLAYYYPHNPLSNVDAEAFDQLCEIKDFAVTAQPSNSGGLDIYKGSQLIGSTKKLGKMLEDWLTRGDPVVCGITGTSEGAEAIGIGFYRETESKLSGYKMQVVRLTKNRDEDTQFTLSMLEDGEMLSWSADYLDECGALVVFSSHRESIGCLPARLTKFEESGEIRGLYVDHVDDIMDDNGNEKYTAYARIYIG